MSRLRTPALRATLKVLPPCTLAPSAAPSLLPCVRSVSSGYYTLKPTEKAGNPFEKARPPLPAAVLAALSDTLPLLHLCS